MSSIILSEKRVGNFTSSEIFSLLKVAQAGFSFGAPAITYIEEKCMERRLGRSIDSEESARNLSWGSLAEVYVSQNPDLLSLEYRINLSDTSVHPEIDFWVGSEDAITDDAACDIKSPRTLKSFCQLVDCVYVHNLSGMEAMNHIRKNHKDGDKYYWQIVSNAIIHGKAFGELIVFVPYQSQLQELRELANNWDGADQFKYMWVYNASDAELPYLKDGGLYGNITIIRFEIPKEDIEFLTMKVKAAGTLLIPRSEQITVTE